MIGWIVIFCVFYTIWRMISWLFGLDKYKGIISASKDPVVMNGIKRMNNTMNKWEKEDGIQYPRFRLLDWFTPAKPVSRGIASRQVSKYINN